MVVVGAHIACVAHFRDIAGIGARNVDGDGLVGTNPNLDVGNVDVNIDVQDAAVVIGEDK